MNPAQSSIHEQLHALADGQLDHAQSRRVLALVESDPVLQKALCDIQRVKHLVQLAYPLPVVPPQQRLRYSEFMWQRAAVYVLALGLAFTAGAAGSQYFSQRPQAEGIALENAPVHNNRFVVFLDSHESAKLEKALNKAEKLATQVADSGGSVYVVTSAEGLDLLRLGITQYEGRIFQMSQAYPHLRFVACSNTLYAYAQRDELVDLVEGAEITPSAVEFVVQHLRQGWRYIAI